MNKICPKYNGTLQKNYVVLLVVFGLTALSGSSSVHTESSSTQRELEQHAFKFHVWISSTIFHDVAININGSLLFSKFMLSSKGGGGGGVVGWCEGTG